MAEQPKADFLGRAFEAFKEAAPQAGRFTVGVLLRRLASDKECLTMMSKAMAEDANSDWDKLDKRDQRELRYQARAALAGLHQYLVTTEKRNGGG